MAASERRILTSHRAIRESLARPDAGSVLYVSGSGPGATALTRLAGERGIATRRVSRSELRRIAPDAHDCALELSSEALAGAGRGLETVLGDAGPSALVLILDHVTDPHNLGAILRSADLFAANAVIVPGRRAAPLTAAAVQASAGTARHVPMVTVPNLAATVATLQEHDFWVYAAEMGGQRIQDSNLTGRVALIMGSEGKGVSRLLTERADARVRIPINGHADSLNVSVACGILLYEVRRQQGWLDRS